MPLIRVLAPRLSAIAATSSEAHAVAERYSTIPAYPDWQALFPQYDFVQLEAFIDEAAQGSGCLSCNTTLSLYNQTLAKTPFDPTSPASTSPRTPSPGSSRISTLSMMASSLCVLLQHLPSSTPLSNCAVLACQSAYLLNSLVDILATSQSSYHRYQLGFPSAPSLGILLVMRTALAMVGSWSATTMQLPPPTPTSQWLHWMLHVTLLGAS